MVRSLLLEGTRVGVVAAPGPGKTFALELATREAWSLRLAAMRYWAPPLRAAQRSSCRRTRASPARASPRSSASLRRRPLPPCAVVVLDEASSMVGTRQLAALGDDVQRADAKLVLRGDHRQLPELAVGARSAGWSGALRLAVELRENRRQSQTWERAAVEDLRDGRVDKAIAAYDVRGRRTDVTFAWGREAAARCGLVQGRLGRGRRDDRRAAKRRHRSQRPCPRAHGAAGRLGHEELRLPAGRFAAGDRVVVKHNDQALGVANGERGTVVTTSTYGNALSGLRSRTVGAFASTVAS